MLMELQDQSERIDYTGERNGFRVADVKAKVSDRRGFVGAVGHGPGWCLVLWQVLTRLRPQGVCSQEDDRAKEGNGINHGHQGLDGAEEFRTEDDHQDIVDDAEADDDG